MKTKKKKKINNMQKKKDNKILNSWPKPSFRSSKISSGKSVITDKIYAYR